MNYERCIYNPASNSIVDFLRDDESDEVAIARLAEYGTGLIALPIAEASKRYEDAFKTPPVEITAGKWTEMLEVLPPTAWFNTADGESFKMIEHTAGAVTGIYVRIDERYFSFQDDCRLKHAECCRRVRESDAFKTVT